MTDGLGSETQARSTEHENGVVQPQPVRTRNAWRTLVFIGLAAATAGMAFVIVRSTLQRPPSDPTTERIQSLIDEANRLLKQLDDQKRG